MKRYYYVKAYYNGFPCGYLCEGRTEYFLSADEKDMKRFDTYEQADNACEFCGLDYAFEILKI